MTNSSVSHRFNWRAVTRTIGMLLFIEACFMAVPTVVSAAIGEDDFIPFLLSLFLTVFAGTLCAVFARPRRKNLGRREGILLTAIVWVVFSLFGMLPFIFSKLDFNVADAFFESMSGFTTTGASVMDEIDHLSYGMHLWRCLTQWIGGMGIIIFTVAVIPMFNSSGGMQMFFAETTGIIRDKLRPRVSQTAKRIWTIYGALTVVLALLLWIGPMNFFESICHALSTISTGGFSTETASLSTWNSLYLKIVVLVFMFIGGVNFALLYRASIGRMKLVWKDEILRAYIRIILVMALFFAVMILANGAFSSWEDVVVNPLFQVVSVISSTGYIIADLDSWGFCALPCIVLLMFIGGCAGSTSGGAKVDRMLYLWKNTRNVLRKNIHPNRFYPLTINGRSSSPDTLSKVCAFLLLYIVLMILGAILLSLTGVPLEDSCFAAYSCIANTGLGSGVTEVSYDIIPDTGKWLLAFLMLIGRLEIFTVLVILTRSFWRK